MFKKALIVFFSLLLIFSIVTTTTSAEENLNTKYKTVQISQTVTVRAHPQAFPGEFVLAASGVLGVYAAIPRTLSLFIAWGGFTSAMFAGSSTTNYKVTKYVYWLTKPTSSSAGYYKLRIQNTSTGKVEFSKAFNIGKNGY